MPLDVINFVASEVILRNGRAPAEPATAARLSLAASLIPGVAGLVVPIIAARPRVSVGGAERIAVPDVVGSSLDDASATLKADRLLTRARSVFSNEVVKGTVIRQVPVGGADVPENFSVQLIVSDGPPPPDDGGEGDVVTPKDLDAAKLELEARIDGLGAKIDALAKKWPSYQPAPSTPPVPAKTP